MKKTMILFAMLIVGISTYAQTNDVEVTSEEIQEVMLPKPSFGDYFEGYTKKITYDRMIPPYGLEITFDKTVHIIFPAEISYVDLGSSNILAGKATGSENVIRVKAAVRGFETETNMAVITNDGSFYTFNH
ncbi:hypothetical protein HMPREF1214_03322 [Bacteroides sp. HPS0048]|nr:DUF4138 domain-containing protein [Bacteroides sp. HPS0048]EOA56094.1 hypothetical protein HMPREF1214_03322 [Bacteroides sp. HPS0048]